MRWTSVWATISVYLFVFESSSTAPSSAPVVKLASYQIVKKPVHIVSDKFLSFTVDPNSIARVAECSSNDGNTTFNMAKSLTPAYFRVAGVDSNRLVFQSNPNLNRSDITSKSRIFPVTNTDWLKWNEFLSKTGMNVIACVSGETEPSSKGWDLSNTLELITFSDKHNISLDWQLGYELQKLPSSQGKQMGRDVARLRKILDVFPKYRKSLIIGPDMTNFRTQSDAMFVRNYLTEAGDSLDAFTWHPFSKGGEDNEVLEMLANGMNSMDNYLWIKDGLMKSSSKGVVPKKSIWIAESENTETVSNLSDSMSWIMRIGAAAKLGASVYLKRPHLLSFYEPTPEYWTAVLYKSLVGRTVLHMKQTSGNGTNKIQMFTHCTKFIEKPEESIINPEIFYDPGSITVYGVNMASESTRISFKIGYKSDETAHLYVLTEDASGDFPKTLLNKQLLGLSPENQLPIISPRVRESPKYLLIPARSIFFVVFPNTKCRSCNEYDSPGASKGNIKITEEEDVGTNTFASNVLEVMEDENDHDAAYVNYRKHPQNGAHTPDDSSQSQDFSNSHANTKYVTFSTDTWMNPFPEKFKDVINKEKDESSNANDKNKAQMYRILAQALLGKRTVPNSSADLSKLENPATRFVFEDDNSESIPSKRALKNSGRFKRSSEPISTIKPESKEPVPESESQKTELIDDYESEQKMPKREENKENSSDLSVSDDSQNIAIYLFDQQDNETHSLETQNLIKTNALALTKENLPEVTKSAGFQDAVPVVTFIKKSTLDSILGAANDRIKRETSEGGLAATSEAPSSSSQNSTTQNNETKDAIDKLIKQVAQLVAQFIYLSSFPAQSRNGSFNSIHNRTNLYRMITLAMLNRGKAENLMKNPLETGNPTMKFDDEESDKFNQALKNLNRFKRWTESLPADKEESSKAIDSQVTALYLFDHRDSEDHTSKTEKRSTLSQISAVPLNENSLEEAMKSNEFHETVPIVTFLPRKTLERIVEAANNRIKRETTSENTSSAEVDNSTNLPTTSSPINSSDEITTQSSTSQSPSKVETNITKLSSTLLKGWLGEIAEIQSTVTVKPNLQQANSSLPDLAKESDDSKILRESREVAEESEAEKNILGSRQFKAINKPNFRPVSPFSKKTKNAKSKIKGKSSDKDQLNHPDVPITLASENEPVVSAKRNIQQTTVSSPSSPSEDLAKSSKSSDESEDDMTDDSATVTKLQMGISGNSELHHAKQTPPQVDAPNPKMSHSQEYPQLVQAPVENVASKMEIPSPSDTLGMVGKPLLKLPSLADLERERNRRQKLRVTPQPIKKLRITPDQLRSSLEHKRRELLQKHFDRLNELRSALGMPVLHLPHTQVKRSANFFDDAAKGTKEFFSGLWGSLRHWEPKNYWMDNDTDETSDEKPKRDVEYIDEDAIGQHSSSSLGIFENNRPKRNAEMVVSSTIQPKDLSKVQLKDSSKVQRKNFSPEDYKKLMEAHIAERRRQMQKMLEERKALKPQGRKQISYRRRRDVKKNTERLDELREQKRIRDNERRQKLAKHREELKQKIFPRRPKRDLQSIKDKIQESREKKHQRRSEFHKKLDQRFSAPRPEIHHTFSLKTKPAKQSLIRNKRDVQTVQDKIQELRQKKQERRQASHKKPQVDPPSKGHQEHPVDKIDEPQHRASQPPTSSNTPKSEISKIEEPQHRATQPPSSNKPKSKTTKIEDPQHQASQPPTSSNAPKSEISKIEEPQHRATQPPSSHKPKSKATKIEDPQHRASQPPTSSSAPKSEVAKIEEPQHQATQSPSSNKPKSKNTKIDDPHHQDVNKITKKDLKAAPIREKPRHRLSKRDVNENQLEEKTTLPADLQKNLRMHLYADPELNTPQSMLEGMKYDDLDRLRRSLSDNEIFDDDDGEAVKIKKKDPEEYHRLKLNKNNEFVLESDNSTPKSTIDSKIGKGNSKIKMDEVDATASSQENQTCQLTNYKVFTYLWCLAQKLPRLMFRKISIY